MASGFFLPNASYNERDSSVGFSISLVIKRYDFSMYKTCPTHLGQLQSLGGPDDDHPGPHS